MSVTTRLWLTVEPATTLERAVAVTYRVPGAQCATPVAELAELRARDAAETPAEFATRIAAELSRIAARHAGQQVAIVGTAPWIAGALAASLAVPSDRSDSLLPRRDATCIVDWPSAHDAAPALVAVDVDWTPPPPSARRAKFPGGPGSAPSTRG